MKKILRVTTVLLGLVIAALLASRVAMFKKVSTAAHPAYGTVSDFRFTDQNGRSFGKSDLSGKAWVADFVFTRCMGPCPMLTTRMAQLQTEFAAKNDLHFVSFSVDPEYDTPAVLKKYAAAYGANGDRWHFLTGSKTAMFDLIRTNFRLAVEKQTNDNPAITDILHSLHFVLVDSHGTILGYFNSNDEADMKRLRDEIKAS